MNIAVITREIAPMTKNGGIGTAVRGLCEALTSHGGHRMTVYYTGRPDWSIGAFSAELRKCGMEFRVILSLPGLLLRDPVRRCRKAYDVLSKTRHDMYLFHEFMADGLFCLRTHRQEGAFANCRLGVVTHGSALWVDEGNGCVARGGKRRHMYAMEQECCELADFVVSPSQYLVDWMREHGWKLPEETHCIPNFIPVLSDTQPGDATQTGVVEPVFFGRLEERKGLRVFCEALTLLPRELLAGRCVTFLGKEAGYTPDNVQTLLQRQIAEGLRLTFLTDYGPHEALAYLRSGRRLAVMPSLRENSPCAVAECLEQGVPFLASSVGGGKELVRVEDRARMFCVPEASILAERLHCLLRGENMPMARPMYTRETLFAKWQALLAEQCSERTFNTTGLLMNGVSLRQQEA